MRASAQEDKQVEAEPNRTRDRDLTERRLVQAALETFRSEGVLAGLNLRDVAKQAGVARGNIYNYFGNRRQLLRRALSYRIAELDDYDGVSTLPFVERKMRLVAGGGPELQTAELVALLAIDGDEDLIPMPFFDEAMARMQADAADGNIHPDYADDLVALHIAIHTARRGYNLFRTAYARQIDMPVEELDALVRPLFEDWFKKLAQPRSHIDD